MPKSAGREIVIGTEGISRLENLQIYQRAIFDFRPEGLELTGFYAKYKWAKPKKAYTDKIPVELSFSDKVYHDGRRIGLLMATLQKHYKPGHITFINHGDKLPTIIKYQDIVYINMPLKPDNPENNEEAK
jgi:hypothetical protein